MPYAPFHELCPEVAERETRTITILPGSNVRLPAAAYQFIEMYCDEPGCDCRRLFFNVMSSATMDVVAVIAWGWESLGFYRRWLGMNDPEMIKDLKGPILNLCSPQTVHSGAVLQLAQRLLLTDAAYVERIKRHYAMFREKIDGHQEKPSKEKPSRKGQWEYVPTSVPGSSVPGSSSQQSKRKKKKRRLH